MTIYRGRPSSPVEDQRDLMRSHVTRGVPVATKTDGGRTPRMAVPPAWMSEALCIGDYSFDETHGMKAGQAAQLCEGCPVLAQCLESALAEEHGLSAGNRYGVRGGLSPKERAQLAFSEKVCERGHRDRWTSHQNTYLPVCQECAAEDKRARYAARVAADPDYRARLSGKVREARSVQRVSCLECKVEMRTNNFPRHLDRKHGEQVAA